MSTDTEVIERVESITKLAPPNLYKVLLHNDDKTTVDFVIGVLIKVFNKSFDEAIQLTQAIHEQGQGIAGSPYTKEIAEEKVHEVSLLANHHGFPLTATFEVL